MNDRPVPKTSLPPQGATGPILLVEDDRHIRELEAEALRDRGCEVIEASDADEALAC